MKKNTFKFLLSVLFLSLFIFSVSKSPVIAQTTAPTKAPADVVPTGETPQVGINITLSPIYFDLITDPGKSVSNQLKVRNNNSFTEYLQLDLSKFVTDPNAPQPVIQDLEPGDDFANWISLDPQKFSLAPGQTKTIKFTISPPKSAALGYYYAIVINRVKEREAGKRETAVKGAAAVAVLLDVRSPNAKRNLSLVEFTTDKLFYEYPPVSFNVKVKNSGNIHVIPVGDIFIDGGGEKQVGAFLFNSGRGNILPQSTRVYTQTWDDSFILRLPKMENGQVVKDNKGNTLYTTKWDLTKVDKFRIGKYTAHLLMSYDNGQIDVPLEATVTFWIIPWKILLGALIVIYLIVLGLKDRIGSIIRKVRKS